MTVLAKRNFAAGEVAPGTPCDFKAFLNGVKTLTNWRVMRMGGIENRPGTIYVKPVKDSTQGVRLLPFVFDSSNAYVLELGDYYMRFYKNGAWVSNSAATTWDATEDYEIGDLIVSAGAYYYCIKANVNTSPPSAAYWYAIPNTGAYEIPTPWAIADLDELRFAQTADVMTIVHPSYAPRQLQRYSNSKWIIAYMAINPLTTPPLNGNLGAAQNQIWETGAGHWLDGTPTQGNVTFSWGGSGGGSSGSLAWNASNATIQTAFDTMVGGAGRVTVTNQFTGVNPMRITFIGALAGAAQPAPYVTASTLIRNVLYTTFPFFSAIQTGTPTSGLTGLNTYQYKTTALNKLTKEESLPGYGPAGGYAISNITVDPNGDVRVTTSGAHGLLDGDEIFMGSMTAAGVPQLDNQRVLINYLSTTVFYLRDTDGTNFGTWTSGGIIYPTQLTATLKAVPTAGNPIKVNPGVVDTTIASVNIYKKNSQGIYGFVGNVQPNQVFNDTNIAPDITLQPPKYTTLFASANNYPSVCCYYQQRLFLGATNNFPVRIWGSRIGYYNNFTVSDPIVESDSIDREVAGFGRVSKIQHLIASSSLVVLTSEGEINIHGLITPNTGAVSYDSNFGSSSVPPFIVGPNVVFQQRGGSILRDEQFSFEGQGYRGNDLTVFSSHIVDGYTFSDMSYQYNAQSIINQIRSDGVKVVTTYLKEQEVLGWATNTTDGTYENTVVIPESSQDVEYQVVKRTVNSATVRYVEYTANRNFSDLRDAYFMDAAIRAYDGRNTSATTLNYANVGGADRLVSSVAYFAPGDVGKYFRMYNTSDPVGWDDFLVTSYTNNQVVLVTKQSGTVNGGVALNTTTALWAIVRTAMTGLDHLEAKEVSIYADKFVIASPNNADYAVLTVASGAITLPRRCAVVNIGLPYMSDVETLNIDFSTSETLADKKKAMSRVGLSLDASRGLWAGPKPPSDDDTDPLEDLRKIGDMNDEDYEDPVELVTGFENIPIKPEWNSNGRVFIRQVDPVPARITAIYPGGKVFGK